MTEQTKELELTGERLLTNFFNEDSIEHLHRYSLAKTICQSKDVLDIASGEGYGANIISQTARTVTGVDISKEAVEHARNKYKAENLTFIHGSAQKIPLPDNSVDIVTSFETLEHHDKHQEMFSEIKRVLRPNGVLMMSTPDKHYYSDVTGLNNEHHVKELYLEEFRDLARAFFETVEIYNQDTVLASVIMHGRLSGKCTHFRGDHNKISESDSLITYRYNICIASNGPVPTLESSIFDAPEILDSYRSSYYGAELAIANNRLENARNEIENIRSSFSFRIGRALTFPIRVLFG